MTNDADVRHDLLARIRARRVSICAFVHDLEPRGARLTNLSIICSALVTALTAGPALGGGRFTEGVQDAAGLSSESVVWRTLCFAAMVLSIVAAITTNMLKSRDVAARLTKAEAANAALEGLEALVEFGQVQVKEAVNLYQQYVAEIPFIPEQPPRTSSP